MQRMILAVPIVTLARPAACRAAAPPGSPELRANRCRIQWQHKHGLVPRTLYPPSAGMPNCGHTEHGPTEHSMHHRQASIGTKRPNLSVDTDAPTAALRAGRGSPVTLVR